MKMRELASVLLVAAIVLIFILIAAISAGNMKSDIMFPYNLKHTAVAGSHAPISIDGNKALASFIKDEGLSGDGTFTSPYMIENFIINASTAHGISIQSTDAYLIIRNCTIEGCFCCCDYDGINLDNASNVHISNNLLSNTQNGIRLFNSSNKNTLSGNTANDNYKGISLSHSSNYNTLSGNTGNNNSWGIELFSASNNTISGNTAKNNNYGIDVNHWSNNNTLSGNTANYNSVGISLTHSHNNTLSGNTAKNNNYGIDLYFSSNNTLSGNTAKNNEYGIDVSHWSNNNTLSGNTVNNNYRGISLGHSTNYNTIHFNNIYENTNAQAIEEGDAIENQWDNGSSGNYWGVDYINNYPSATNDGRIWSTPYEINGTGNGVDHFPLVNAVTTTTETTATTTTPSWTFPVLSLTIIALLPFRRLKRI
ncbi:MAG: right-handed parallel beta-helix repeat-containing protein [Candidatus Hodarchaeales archaeon]